LIKYRKISNRLYGVPEFNFYQVPSRFHTLLLWNLSLKQTPLRNGIL